MSEKKINFQFHSNKGPNKELVEMAYKGLVLDTESTTCNRGRVDTGTFCNYDCEFCYYKDQLDVKDSWEKVKERIDYLKQYGINEVSLSGGESSVSPDWFKILDYCSELFDHISCLSHGGRFANMDFLKESYDHGLREIRFSLHGATEEVHDAITGRKGSFKRILQGINNAKELGMTVRTNATIYYRNTGNLAHEHADLINEIHPVEANFLTLNYWGDYNIIKFENVDYKAMTDGLKACIDKVDPSIPINIRYAPYCYMKGYEKYVCGTFQHIYDVNDWNREVFNYDIDVSKPYTHEEKTQLAYDACQVHRKLFYTKKMECVTCKHFYICDGLENEIADKTPVFPEPGEKITQINFYRK